MFQRRHFRFIAELGAKMRLDEKQQEILVDELAHTNKNFDKIRFKEYMRDKYDL